MTLRQRVERIDALGTALEDARTQRRQAESNLNARIAECRDLTGSGAQPGSDELKGVLALRDRVRTALAERLRREELAADREDPGLGTLLQRLRELEAVILATELFEYHDQWFNSLVERAHGLEENARHVNQPTGSPERNDTARRLLDYRLGFVAREIDDHDNAGLGTALHSFRDAAEIESVRLQKLLSGFALRWGFDQKELLRKGSPTEVEWTENLNAACRAMARKLDIPVESFSNLEKIRTRLEMLARRLDKYGLRPELQGPYHRLYAVYSVMETVDAIHRMDQRVNRIEAFEAALRDVHSWRRQARARNEPTGEIAAMHRRLAATAHRLEEIAQGCQEWTNVRDWSEANNRYFQALAESHGLDFRRLRPGSLEYEKLDHKLRWASDWVRSKLSPLTDRQFERLVRDDARLPQEEDGTPAVSYAGRDELEKVWQPAQDLAELQALADAAAFVEGNRAAAEELDRRLAGVAREFACAESSFGDSRDPARLLNVGPELVVLREQAAEARAAARRDFARPGAAVHDQSVWTIRPGSGARARLETERRNLAEWIARKWASDPAAVTVERAEQRIAELEDAPEAADEIGVLEEFRNIASSLDNARRFHRYDSWVRAIDVLDEAIDDARLLEAETRLRLADLRMRAARAGTAEDRRRAQRDLGRAAAEHRELASWSTDLADEVRALGERAAALRNLTTESESSNSELDEMLAAVASRIAVRKARAAAGLGVSIPGTDVPGSTPDAAAGDGSAPIGQRSDEGGPGERAPEAARIVVVGSPAFHCTIETNELPGPGAAARVRAMRVVPGGVALRQGVALARSGAEVSVIGAVGDDAFGQGARAVLEHESGSGAVRIARGEPSAGVVRIVRPDGGESVLRFAPPALEVTVEDVGQNLATLRAADAVLIAPEVSDDVVRAIDAAVETSERAVVIHRLPSQEGSDFPDSAEPAALLSALLPGRAAGDAVAAAADPPRPLEFLSEIPDRAADRAAAETSPPAGHWATSGPRVVVVGSAVADLIIGYDRFPGAGESADAGSVRMNPGGKGLSLATQSARLGAEVQLVTAIGRDVPGAQVEEVLAREDIGSRWTRIEEQAPTETVVCLLDTAAGDASFLEHTSPGVKLTAADVERTAELIGSADVAVITYEVPDDVIAEICEVARRDGTKIVLQPAPAPERFSVDTVRMADVLVPNEIEARTLLAAVDPDTATIPAEQLAARLSREFAVRTVVVTLGAAGCAVCHDGNTRLYPADPVDSVVETIGASDSFTATLAVRLECGDSIDSAVRTALSAAAHTIARPGGYASMPYHHDLGLRRAVGDGTSAENSDATAEDSAFERTRDEIWSAHGHYVGAAIGRVLRTMTRAEWERGLARLGSMKSEYLAARFERGWSDERTAAELGQPVEYVQALERFAVRELAEYVRRERAVSGAAGADVGEDGPGTVTGRGVGTPSQAGMIINVGRIWLNPVARRAWVDRSETEFDENDLEEISLSEKEFALLDILTLHQGRVVGRNDIEEAVWGERLLNDNALRVLVRRLRAKLKVEGSIVSVSGVGYRFDSGMRTAWDGIRIGRVELWPESRQVWVDQAETRVSGTLLELLEYFMRRAGDVVSLETIRRDIWRNSIEPQTVRGYVSSLRKQLGDRGFIVWTEGGWRFDGNGSRSGNGPLIGTRSDDADGGDRSGADTAGPRGSASGPEEGISFRYVTGRDLAELRDSVVELNETSWDGDATRLGLDWWTDPRAVPGAVVAEVGGPGGQLVGFCLAQQNQDLSGSLHLDTRTSGERGENPDLLDPRFAESNVHITTMLVDRSMRGRRIADAMLYTLLLHRRESSFSLYVRPENETAVKVYERVAGTDHGPIGLRLGTDNNDLLYRAPKDTLELLRRRRQLEQWGYRSAGAAVVWKQRAETAEEPEPEIAAIPQDWDPWAGAEPDVVALRRSAGMLPGNISFRYVQGQELVDLAGSVERLNGSSGDGDPTGSGVEWWGDPAVAPGAIVAELDGPGGQLVGFCIGRRQQDLSDSMHLDARVPPGGTRNMIPLEPRFDEPNVHIESMLVDQSVRGFRIADAMMYAFLRNRTETSFSLHVLPENAAAIRASERVGGPSFRPLGFRHGDNAVLYQGESSNAQLDYVRQRLEEWGYTGDDRNLLLEGQEPTPSAPPEEVERRRSLDVLPGDVAFRYVTGAELADLADAMVELNATGWDGNADRLRLDQWADPDRQWGAIVAEVGGPGGRLVGFCLAQQRRDFSGSTYLDARREVPSGQDMRLLDPRIEEPNVHIESMLVDRSLRGFRMADAMVYTLLRHRPESSFSTHVLPENETAIRALERVGGPDFSPLGLRLGRSVGAQDVLYQGPKSDEQLRAVQRQLEEWGFTGDGPELVLRRVTQGQRREAIARLHPHAHSSAAMWARNVRQLLGMSPGRMDYLINAPDGTWREAESGADLTIGQVRALLRRVPGAGAWYPALAEGFFPDLGSAPSRAGSRVRSIRERVNVRPEQLAVRLGVSVTTLDEWEATASWPESRHELSWYLQGLASLLPAAAVSQAGAGIGLCLGALRAHVGLDSRVLAERAEVEPADVPLIEAGFIEPLDSVVEAYLRALLPATPCYPEGYRNELGRYLKYLRQGSGRTLVEAANAVGGGMTTAGLEDYESGRAVPSVRTVGIYLDEYSDGSVSIDECVEAFPELGTSAARRTAERERAAARAEDANSQLPEPAAKPTVASMVAPDAGSPGGVRLHGTAGLSDADDLVQAIVASADVFAATNRSAGRILRRFPDWEEVTSDVDRASGVRSFAFRVFERGPDRTVAASETEPRTAMGRWWRTVAARRRPKVTEVVVRLAEPTSAEEWVGVAEVSTRRDPTLWRAARLPEASPDPVKARRLIGAGVPVAADALRCLDVSTVVADYGPAAESAKAAVRTAEGTRMVAVDDETTCRSVTVMFTDRTTARFDVDVDRFSRRLVVRSSDGRLVRHEPIRAPRAAPPLELAHAVAMALTLALGHVVTVHRTHEKVTADDPRYERDRTGRLRATRAARSDAVAVLAADRLLSMEPRTRRQRRYLFELRRGYLRRLEFARGSRAEQREHLAALRAISARLEYPIRRHWGPLKIRKPVLLHPEDAPPLSVHFLLSLIAAGSNVIPAAVSGNAGQVSRYSVGSVTGSLYIAFGRHLTYSDFARRRADTAPRHWIYEVKNNKYFWANVSGASMDVTGRIGASLMLMNFGIPVDTALLAQIFAKRMSHGIFLGMKSRRLKPMYRAPVDLAEQTLAAAARHEIFDEYAELRKESLLLLRLLLRRIDAGSAPNGEEADEFFGLLHDLIGEMREIAERIDRYGLAPATLRTKASPVRSPTRSRILKMNWLPEAGSASIGLGAATLAGNPWVGLVLGAAPVFSAFIESTLNDLSERLRAAERATRVQRNNAYHEKQWDNALREVVFALARLLDVEPDLPQPRPDAKQKQAGLYPHLHSGVILGGAVAPLTVPGFWVPGMGQSLTVALLLARFFSPVANKLRDWVEEILDDRISRRTDKADAAIALEDAPVDVREIKPRLSGFVARAEKLVQRADDTFVAENFPDAAGVVSPRAVFRELMKTAEDEKNSWVAVERFRKLVAEKKTPELFDAFLSEISAGIEDIEPEKRAGKAASDFLYWHEGRVAAIGKLEMVFRYMSEHLPPELQLEALFSEAERSPLHPEYVEFAELFAKLPFVGATPDAKEIVDHTGRLGAVALLAAVRSGEYTADQVNAGAPQLDKAVLGRLLTTGAELIERDIRRLAHDWNLDALLFDIPSSRGMLDTKSEPRQDQQRARNLLRIALGEPRFRAQYVDRLTRWLADTTQPIAEDLGRGVADPEPIALWRGTAKLRGPLIGTRSDDDAEAPKTPLPEPGGRHSGTVPARRSLDELPGDVVFRYVTGAELVGLADSLVDLERDNWDGPARLGTQEWSDPEGEWGAVVAESVEPDGSRLVGFCLGQRRQDLGVVHSSSRRSRTGSSLPFDARFEEPNVHITAMVVDQSMRRFGMADAMLNEFLLNRTETSLFSVYVRPEDKPALKVVERVGVTDFGQLGRQDPNRDSPYTFWLYQGTRSVDELLERRRQLEERGFGLADGNLVLRKPVRTEPEPTATGPRRSLDELPDDVVLRYVTGPELTGMALSLVGLNRDSWDGDPARLHLDELADPVGRWGAVVAELGGPGGRLVGFCAGQRKQEFNGFSDARTARAPGSYPNAVATRPEPNVHITTMLVDQGLRGFGIAEAMLSTFLLHRTELRFSMQADPEEDKAAIDVAERVGGLNFRPVGLAFEGDGVLYEGPRSTTGLLGRRRRLEQRGFSGAGGDLVLRRRGASTAEQSRVTASHSHPQASGSVANWARRVRGSRTFERMDAVIAAPEGTWEEVEGGAVLTITQVRALLRRIPGARQWYSALAAHFFPGLAVASPRVGSMLRSFRERARVGAEQLAVRLGLSVAELDGWETGWETRTGHKTQQQVMLSPENVTWYLRGLASLLPLSAVSQARMGAAARGGDGGGVGVCLAALRVDAGLEPRFVAEKSGLAPEVMQRIETGMMEPAAEEIQAYLRALAPGIPCYPEGYRSVGEYLRHLRQGATDSLVDAASAAKTTSTMLNDCEWGRVVPSVETVGFYLDRYADGTVSIDECTEAFPELEAAAARRAADLAGLGPEPAWGVHHTVTKGPAASLVTDPVAPDVVRLHDTAGLSDADDLVRAVVAGADVFAELDQRVAPILRRFPDWEEVTSDRDREDGVRSFAFRVFVRRPDRSVDDKPDSPVEGEPDATVGYEPDPTVVGRRQPKFTEVVVRLAKPAARGDWVGAVADVSTRRDPALWKLSRLPEAAPNPEKAQRLIGAGVGVAADALRLLDVTTVAAEYGAVDHGATVLVRTADGVREIPVGDDNTCRRVTLTFRDGNKAQFDVRVDPIHRRLVVSSPNGGLVRTEQIRASGAASTLELGHAVTVALTQALAQAVHQHRGYGKVRPQDPRYVREDGKLVATRAARVDAVLLLALDELLALKPRTDRQWRYLFDLRREVLRRLEFARGPRSLQQERRAALLALSARLEAPIRQHWGPLRIRKPRVLHPEAAPPFALHYGLSLIAAGSNGFTYFLADDPSYKLRGATGTLTGSIYLAGSRYGVYVEYVRSRRADNAPRHFIYQVDGRKYFYHHFVGKLLDGAARVGGSLVLAGVGGAPIAPALLGGLFARKAAEGFFGGLRSASLKPLYSAPEDLVDQTMAVAVRGEVFNEYIRLREDSLRLARQLRKYLAEQKAPDKSKLIELVGRLERLYTEMRELADLIERYGLAPAALRTKAAPVNSPSPNVMLATGAVAPVGSAGAGALVTWALGDPWLGLLGTVGVYWHIVSSRVTGITDRFTAAERAVRTQRNLAYEEKQWDDAVREPLTRIAELLDRGLTLPDPLPDAKRKWVGPAPYTLKGLGQAIAESPFTVVGSFLLGPGAALAYIFERFLSPITNGLRSFAEEIFDQVTAIRNKEIEGKKALEEGPDRLSEIVGGISEITVGAYRLRRSTGETFDPANYPDFAGAVSPAAVFEELMKKGQSKKNSSNALERFKQLVAEKDTPELFDSFIASITTGFDDLEPQERASKAAAAFLEWHETRVAAIGKLEMVDRYIAEYLPPELRVTGLFPEGRRTPLNPQYYEYARAVAELPIVAETPKSHKILDYTGLLVSTVVLAAARNGVYLADPDHPEARRLDTVTLGYLLTAGAKLMERDFLRLVHEPRPDELLTDARPLRAGESVDTRQGVGVVAEGAVGAAAYSLRLDAVEKRLDETKETSQAQLDAARSLLRGALRNPQFRAAYIDRLAWSLADTQAPVAEDTGRVYGEPEPIVLWRDNTGVRGPLIGSRDDSPGNARSVSTPWSAKQAGSMDGSPVGQPEIILSVGRVRHDPRTRTASVDGRSVTLRPTESRLLHYLMWQSGRVVSRAEIERALWDKAPVHDNAVDGYIFALRRQLGAPDLIAAVSSAGYRFDGGARFAVEPLGVRERTIVVGRIRLSPAAHTVAVDGEDIQLRPREFHLLRLLLQHAGFVVSHSDIEESAWQDTVSAVAIRTSVTRLRDKLGDRGCITALDNIGWRFDGLPGDRALVDEIVANDSRTIELGGIRQSPVARRVWRQGVEVFLTAKEFGILYCLLQKAGQVVRRDKIELAVWGDRSSNPKRFTTQVWSLRTKLGDTGGRLIETISPGLRFNPDADSLPDDRRPERDPVPDQAPRRTPWAERDGAAPQVTVTDSPPPGEASAADSRPARIRPENFRSLRGR
ncbi:PfkB family carbohydrate kinase [Nocardia wallacei]|uniref:PfkB family carbohydrate kinase n=1 Tax=Nocardia wallacei TaxID=480035 RepID=UPI0024544CB2|nr:PfkB family carbohydrate kinase [Nocardia wallacei]